MRTNRNQSREGVFVALILIVLTVTSIAGAALLAAATDHGSPRREALRTVREEAR